MTKKAMLTVFGVVFICMHSIYAQDLSCEVPEKIVNSQLGIEVMEDKFEIDRWGSVKSYFKIPSTSTQVNETDWINCDGIMPNGATINSVEILSISGLPQGLEWYCNKENNFYNGGETGCLTIEGKTLEKGKYQIVINMKGVGSLWRISRDYDCIIKSFELVVE